MRHLICLTIMLTSAFAQATVYKWVDKDGKVHYSDEPQANAQVLELTEKTLNNIAPPAAPKPITATQAIEEVRYQVEIVSPTEEATLRNNNGDFDVTVQLTPEIDGQYLLALKLDGKLIGTPQASNTFKLTNIDRGEHILVVDAMTQNGKVFASSSPRKVFLHQATRK